MPLHSLPLFHRIAGTRVVVVGDGEMAEAKVRLVERAGGVVCAETEAHQAAIAFVALEDERAARAAHLRLKRAGLLVNVADMPELCDFTLPSILERDPVLVAVSTGGASAGLAKQLRLRLERLLPPGLGTLAARLGAARNAIRERFPAGAQRRRAIDAALSEGGMLDVLRAGTADRVDEWLAGGDAPAPSRHEFVLHSPDPDELTVKQARLLGEADVVLHDAHVPEAILVRARADAARHVLPCEMPDGGAVVVLRWAQG